jgi:hypothetical protein
LKRSELLRYDIGRREFVSILPAISATFFEYSRDGQSILYVSYPEGELWRSRADGSKRQQLTSRPLIVGLPRWSPDGRHIALLARNPRKPWKPCILPAEGGVPREIAPNTEMQAPSWSPDGTRLVLGSPKPGISGLGILELKTAKVSPLSGSAGLTEPIWSPDGRYISARRLETGASMLFDVEKQTWSEIEGPASGCVVHAWTPDSAGFFCVEGKGTAIHRFDVKTAEMKKIVDLRGFRAASPGSGAGVGVAADGSPLLSRDAGSQEIYALEW